MYCFRNLADSNIRIVFDLACPSEGSHILCLGSKSCVFITYSKKKNYI